MILLYINVHICLTLLVIEFLPAELKGRLLQIREQDEHVQSKNSNTLWHMYTCQQSLPLLTQEAFLCIEKGGMEVDTPHSYIHVHLDVCTFMYMQQNDIFH